MSNSRRRIQHIMTESPKLEEENIINDVNLFRLEKIKKKQLILQ